MAILASRRMTNAEIARILSVGEGTVKNHIHSILDKTGLKRRSDLIATDILPRPNQGDLQKRLDVLGVLVDQLRAEYEALLCWVRDPKNALKPVDVEITGP